MSYRVYDYTTGAPLTGEPSVALIEASLSAGWVGAVRATRDADGIWQPRREEETDGTTVVYVERGWTTDADVDRERSTTRTISSLTRYGSEGWSWTEQSEDTGTRRFRTNGAGRGLWEELPVNGGDGRTEDRQTEGTTQFSLPSDRELACRRFRKLFYGNVTISED